MNRSRWSGRRQTTVGDSRPMRQMCFDWEKSPAAGQQVEWWISISEYPAYEVSDWGRIRSYWGKVCLCEGGPNAARGSRRIMVKEPKIHNLNSGKRGYVKVSLTNERGIEKTMDVHVVVMMAFVGPCPAGMEVRHLDGNPANNRLKNLSYGT